MGIHIVQKAELENVSARLLPRAIMIQVHHLGEGGTLQTAAWPGEFQEMLKELQGLFGKRTYKNSQNGRPADFEIKTDQHCKIPLRSPNRISPWEEPELRRQIHKTIHCGWIEPSRSNFGPPVLFVPKPDCTLHMCLEYHTLNAITVKDRYPRPHIEDLPNSMHCFCWFTKLDLAAC